MSKIDKLDKISDELSKLQKRILMLRKDELELTEKYNELLEEYYRYSPDMVAIVCFGCNGEGWIQQEEKKITCRFCKGKGYIWGKKWTGKKE